MPIAKNPPPPSSETVRLNGRCRSEKLKRTSAGFESNGSVKPAPSDTCSSAKIPTADRREVQRVAGAEMPLGVTDRLGGSLKPFDGMMSCSSFTNSSGPPNGNASSTGMQVDRDVRLLAALGEELEAVEPDDDEPEQVHLEVARSTRPR